MIIIIIIINTITTTTLNKEPLKPLISSYCYELSLTKTTKLTPKTRMSYLP